MDQASGLSDEDARFVGKADVQFVGVSNKTSLESLVDNNIIRVGAKKVFPLHFDFFFLQSESLEKQILPASDLGEIADELAKKSKNQKFIVPKLNESILLP